jgi:hypothetical protein
LLIVDPVSSPSKKKLSHFQENMTALLLNLHNIFIGQQHENHPSRRAQLYATDNYGAGQNWLRVLVMALMVFGVVLQQPPISAAPSLHHSLT